MPRCAVLAVSCFAASVFIVTPALAQETVTVDATAVVRRLSPTFHGINYVGFWDSAQGSESSRVALGQTSVRTIRFPGGDPGDWYDWQCPFFTDDANSPCPGAPTGASWSSTDSLKLWNYAQALGGRLMLQTNFEGNGLPNPPGKNYAVNSAENAGAWAAYALAHGIDALFEIGNEDDIHMLAEHDENFQPYVDAFQEHAAAIHDANPNAQVFGPAGTNEWYWWALDSLGMFLEQVGNKTGDGSVDGVSLHFYVGGDGWETARGAAQYWQSPGGPWEFIQGRLIEHDTRDLPVHISEWHLGPANASFNATMQNALATADLIGAFADSGLAGYEYFTIHGVNTDPNSWGMLHGDNESRSTDTPTPVYYGMVMWAQMGFGMLALSQSSDPELAVSSYATTRDDGSVQVMLINKSDSARQVTVGFTGYAADGRQVKVHTLSPTGDRTSLDVVYNGQQNPAPSSLPMPAVQTVSGSTFPTNVPSSSIVVLSFAGDGTMIPGGGGTNGGGGAPGIPGGAGGPSNRGGANGSAGDSPGTAGIMSRAGASGSATNPDGGAPSWGDGKITPGPGDNTGLFGRCSCRMPTYGGSCGYWMGALVAIACFGRRSLRFSERKSGARQRRSTKE